MRPRAVAQAEWLYLAAVALLAVTTAMTWRPMVAQFGLSLSLGASGFAIGLYLLLTLLTTRRGSTVALWLLVLATVFAIGSLAWQVATGVLAVGWLGLLNAAQAVLMLVGAVLLFRPASRAWFAMPDDERPDGDDLPDEEELA